MQQSDSFDGGEHSSIITPPNSGRRKLNYSAFLTPQQFPKCLQLVFCTLIIILSWHPGVSLLIIVTYSSFLVTGFLIWANLLELPQYFPNKKDYLRLEFYYTVQAAVLFVVSSVPLFFGSRLHDTLIIGLHAGVVYAAGGFAIWEELRSISKGRREEGEVGGGLEKGEKNCGEGRSAVRKLNFRILLEPTTLPKLVQWVFCCILSFSWIHSFLFVVSNISLAVTWTLLWTDLLDISRYWSRKEYLQKQVYFSGGAAASLLMSSLVLNFESNTAWIFGVQAALAYVVGGFLLWEELRRTKLLSHHSTSQSQVVNDGQRNEQGLLQGLIIHQA